MTETTKKITAVTNENIESVRSLFQEFQPAALGQLQKADSPAKLIDRQTYNGNQLEAWHHPEAGQVGLLYHSDGQISLYAASSVLVAAYADNASTPSGVSILMAQHGKFGANGDVGQGLKTAKVVDGAYVNDIMHVMQHDIDMPHNCSGTPAPGK